MFLAPGFASARWHLENEWQLKYAWDEAAGQRGLHDALALIAQAAQHPSGRLSGMVFPAQIDTCTEALLRESCEAAEAQNLPFTTHCAQSVNEFNEMVHRHGRTPIRWAQRHRHSGAAHASSATRSSPTSIPGRAGTPSDDVRILAETGASVAHCPSPFARYGQTLEDFGRYRRAGDEYGAGHRRLAA